MQRLISTRHLFKGDRAIIGWINVIELDRESAFFRLKGFLIIDLTGSLDSVPGSRFPLLVLPWLKSRHFSSFDECDANVPPSEMSPTANLLCDLCWISVK
jgi:hypothetical protein